MNEYTFTTSNTTRPFIDSIAERITTLFGIPLEIAVMLINTHWEGQQIVNEDDIVFHENEDFWAREIYSQHYRHTGGEVENEV